MLRAALLLHASVRALDPSVFGRFRTWPITAVQELEQPLRDMGLNVPAAEIDGTRGDGTVALSDALVSIGAAGRGGTGSFVSDDGLILTNWHVAYEYIRQASLLEGEDFVRDGYVAKSRKEELRAPNCEVWLTRRVEDVSDAVLDVLDEPDPLKRATALRDRRQQIASYAENVLRQQAQQLGVSAEGVRCDVQEMFANEKYLLFTYERLRDVRIAYAPPSSLGSFGGDSDNFEWPRHTADFALLRAYADADNAPADYAASNVPYTPSKRLRLNPAGADDGDFVFLLGFPGRTLRYAPSARLEYNKQVTIPAIVADFERKLEAIQRFEGDSEETRLALAGMRKSLANELKRNRGKLVVASKVDVLEERRKEEKELSDAYPACAILLQELQNIYVELGEGQPVLDALSELRGTVLGSAYLAAAHAVHEASVELSKPDDEREAEYRDRNRPFLERRLRTRLEQAYAPHEAALVAHALDSARRAGVSTHGFFSKGGVVDAVRASPLPETFSLDGSLDAYASDPFVGLSAALYPLYAAVRDAGKALLSDRDRVTARLLDFRRATSTERLWPDCNGALRLSAGRVEGCAPRDAVVHGPRTTLGGLLDKAHEAELRGDDDGTFTLPPRLRELLEGGPEALERPCCLLYSTDTVGGNSGSPVLDSDGDLVAINFDRARGGLMNEFAWSQELSRSIGVDVRLMLWLVGTFDGASDLVAEMTTESKS